MNRLSCAGARRRLSAFHDGELPVEEQIAVEAHVRSCAACDAAVSALRHVGAALRSGSSLSGAQVGGALDGLQAGIMSRLAAERAESVPAQVSRAFEDMRLGFAALGSTMASLVTVLIIIGIFYFGPGSERPDSLAALIESVGSSQAEMDRGMGLPGAAGDGSAVNSGFDEEEAVLALDAVVTRNGRIANFEYLSNRASGGDRQRVERLLDSLSRARLEPARMNGSAVSVRTVFRLAATTEGTKLPITKKQSALPQSPQHRLFG